MSLATGTLEYWLLAHFKSGEGVGRCRVARTVAISQVSATRLKLVVVVQGTRPIKISPYQGT